MFAVPEEVQVTLTPNGKGYTSVTEEFLVEPAREWEIWQFIFETLLGKVPKRIHKDFATKVRLLEHEADRSQNAFLLAFLHAVLCEKGEVVAGSSKAEDAFGELRDAFFGLVLYRQDIAVALKDLKSPKDLKSGGFKLPSKCASKQEDACDRYYVESIANKGFPKAFRYKNPSGESTYMPLMPEMPHDTATTSCYNLNKMLKHLDSTPHLYGSAPPECVGIHVNRNPAGMRGSKDIDQREVVLDEIISIPFQDGNETKKHSYRIVSCVCQDGKTANGAHIGYLMEESWSNVWKCRDGLAAAQKSYQGSKEAIQANVVLIFAIRCEAPRPHHCPVQGGEKFL